MNISRINSAPAFRGELILPSGSFNGYETIRTSAISEIKKYANGTRITGSGQDIFVRNEDASFQDVAAAYNMAKDDLVTVDLTSANMDLAI